MFQNENWFEPIFFDEHQLSSCVSFSDCECVCICIFMYVCIYHLLSLLFSLSLSLCHCSYSSRHRMTTALCAENFISLNAFNANNCHCFANLFHTNAPDFFFFVLLFCLIFYNIYYIFIANPIVYNEYSSLVVVFFSVLFCFLFANRILHVLFPHMFHFVLCTCCCWLQCASLIFDATCVYSKMSKASFFAIHFTYIHISLSMTL